MAEFQSGLVSVIVPVYNRASLVSATLDSVVAQEYRPLELVVIDDGSTDESVRVVEQWIKRHVSQPGFSARLLRQANSGAANARNHGMRRSEGEFLQFLDSDDLLDPAKIALQVAALRAAPNADYAYGPIHELERPERVIYCQSAMDNRRMLLKSLVVTAMQTAGPLLRRATMERIGEWQQSLTPMDDWELYTRLPALGCNGEYTPHARVYQRLEVPTRLSWRGEPERLGQYMHGRLGHLESARRHLGPQWQRDAEVRRTLSWQELYVVAFGVMRGWSGDDRNRFRLAMDQAPASLRTFIRLGLLPLRRVCGATVSARCVLGLVWCYWRWVRVRRLLASR